MVQHRIRYPACRSDIGHIMRRDRPQTGLYPPVRQTSRIHDRVPPVLEPFLFGRIVPMLVQPPVVLGGRPCAGIQRSARPVVDHTMVLVEIRAQYTPLIDPQMQELQPVILVAETRIPSVGARMRPALRIDPARPRPQWGRVRVRSRHALVFHDFLGRVPRPLWSWVNAFLFH